MDRRHRTPNTTGVLEGQRLGYGRRLVLTMAPVRPDDDRSLIAGIRSARYGQLPLECVKQDQTDIGEGSEDPGGNQSAAPTDPQWTGRRQAKAAL